MDRRMLAYTFRPFFTAWTMVAKLSSVRTMAAASLATSVPVMPMATPMSACFRAGASLTPSPVMATRAPLLLPGADDADLMLRGHPGIDGDFGNELLEFLLAHLFHHSAFHGFGAGG